MLIAAIAVGALSSFCAAVLVACVGYFTQLTGERDTFANVLLIFYGATICILLATRYDVEFNRKFPAKHVQSFRIFAPSLGLIFGLALLMFADSKGKIYLISLLVGLCSGALNCAGAILIGVTETDKMPFIWIGVSMASLLCVSLVHVVDFGPTSPDTNVQFYFSISACAALLGFFVLASLHHRGDLDEAYETSTRASLVTRSDTESCQEALHCTEVYVVPYLQFLNSFTTVVAAPLLPALCSPLMCQNLMLWKFLMEFCGSVSAVALPILTIKALVMVCCLKLSLIGLVFTMLVKHTYMKQDWHSVFGLVIAWDCMNYVGTLANTLSDTVGQLAAGSRCELIRRNRIATSAAIFGAIIFGVAVLYVFPDFPFRACRACSSAGKLSASRTNNSPCGPAPPGPYVHIFSYGANMGCAKITELDIFPVQAAPARVMGLCLQFGAAEGVPTSRTEPGFGTLMECAGCAHGMLQVIARKDLHKLSATEPGYVLQDIRVNLYNGTRAMAKAYIMEKTVTVTRPSRRYAGLVYCAAAQGMSKTYADQLQCELEEHGVHNLSCSEESFQPITKWRL